MYGFISPFRRGRRIGAVPSLVASVAASLVSCGEATSPEPDIEATERNLNVVLIVVDTLRADHLSIYGYGRRTSPHIDALAEDAILYERAISQAPWTTPSVGSLLTSLYPSTLGIRGIQSVLRDEHILLSEVLREKGYATGAVISHSFCSSRWNFDQGFDEFDESNVKGHLAVTSGDITERALRFIAEHENEPFFLWLHYFDPHVAFIDHPESSFGGAAEDTGRIESGQDHRTLRSMEADLSEVELTELRRLYDSEIAFTDQAIGAVLRNLRDRGLYDDTIVIFTADHGEEFLDHGRLGHAKTVYQELIHVPLIIRLPGVAPQRVEAPVALLDVYPSLLEYLGIPIPEGVEGSSLLPADLADLDEHRPVFSETMRAPDGSRQTVILGGEKLVVNRSADREEFYHLPSDPDEMEDRSELDVPRVRRLRAILDAWAQRNTGDAGSAPEIEISTEERRRLQALGYGE